MLIVDMSKRRDSLRQIALQVLITLYAIVSCCIIDPLCQMGLLGNSSSFGNMILPVLIYIAGSMMWCKTLRFQSGLILKYINGILLGLSLLYYFIVWMIIILSNTVFDNV